MKKDLFKDHYSVGGNFKVNYIRGHALLCFFKERKILSLFLCCLLLASIGGIICFIILHDLEKVLMTAAIFVSDLTLLSAIYISWYQQFVSDNDSFPFINVDLKKLNKPSDENFMQLDALDKDYYAKAYQIKDVVSPKKCPSNIIEIKDPNNEIYDIDVFYIIGNDSKSFTTNYFIKNESDKISIGIPTRDLIDSNDNIVFKDKDEAFFCVVYSIKTKIKEYYMLTHIFFKKAKRPVYCLHTDVISKAKSKSLLKVKRARKFINKSIEYSSKLLSTIK